MRTKTALEWLNDADIFEMDEELVRRYYHGPCLRRADRLGSPTWLEIDEEPEFEPIKFRTKTLGPKSRRWEQIKIIPEADE